MTGAGGPDSPPPLPPRRSPDRPGSARERVDEAREQARERVGEMRERAAATASERTERARLTVRRLFGLDRSGPQPPETRAGAPLRPWTIPNAIGYIRLALVPAFLAVALADGDGVSILAGVIFAVIAAGDYADGIAARITGQYSRLGALLDPLVDRLLVVSGVVAVYVNDLLPRWALLVLIARELFMLGLVRWGLRQGADVTINWPGRLAVTPLMTGLVAGLVGLSTFGAICLYVGLALALWATGLYVLQGVRHTRAQRARSAAERDPGTGPTPSSSAGG